MKKANITLILVSAYVLIAFAWWTYAHYKNTITIYEQQVQLTEYKCYEASFEMERLRDDDLFEDTTDAKNYFISKYPQLELIFIDSIVPLNGFMVRPALETYQHLENTYKRDFIMYLIEGIVIMLVLLWGIIRLYSTFKKSLDLQRQQSNFLLSVTHELKTPIASIKLYLETLKKRKLNEEQISTIVNNSSKDINRLQNLTENLLLSAQMDGKKFELIKSYINISELIEQSVQKYVEPRNLNQNFTISVERNIYGDFDKNAIEMLVYNLINNAVKYSGKEPKIGVSLKKVANFVELSVSDEGIGINETEKKQIFKKFYRSGNEITRKTKGTGLGLFIVFNIVQLHNGEIDVKNNLPQGTVFTIKLPM
ncbi:MAG: sensor histidine kinase [Bacteroidia bacterium]